MKKLAYGIFLLFGLITIFTSCSKKVEVKKEVVKVPVFKSKIMLATENSWGMKFESKPISQTSTKIQQFGRAVAIIQYAEGGSATGFFVSPDGLFLTNHHVVSRQRCSNDRCAGLMIIRNLRPDETPVVYKKFQVLAHNEALDFALLKVDLPRGERVPYLKLDFTNEANMLDTDLRIIGHPFGSSLRSSKAYYYYPWRDAFYLKSVAISGNSGSPLIDLNTNKVVGLYWAGGWDKTTVDKITGAVEHEGVATPISKIFEALELVYRDVDKGRFNDDYRRFRVAAFENPIEDHDLFFEDILPEDRESLLEDEKIIFSTWVGQAVGQANQEVILNKFLDKVFTEAISSSFRRSSSPYFLESFLFKMARLNLNRGRIIEINDGLINWLVDYIDIFMNIDVNDLNPYFTPFQIQYGRLEVSNCLQKVQEDNVARPIRARYDAGKYCLSQVLENGDDILQTAIDDFDKTNYLSRYDQSTLNRFSSIFEIQLLLREKRNISEEQKRKILDILQLLASALRNMMQSFQAEALYTMLKHDLDIVYRGGWEETFSR